MFRERLELHIPVCDEDIVCTATQSTVLSKHSLKPCRKASPATGLFASESDFMVRYESERKLRHEVILQKSGAVDATQIS